jgi:putative PIN family toxin of toxin-antitoxin system
LRVVFDTNILVSAFVFPGGVPEAVFRMAVEEQIDVISSRPLLAEFGRVLREKFEWEPSRVAEAVAQVVETVTVVHPHERVRVVKEDPADDRVLEAAAAGEAEAIVSGDLDLLRLRSWRGIRILKAAVFLSEFE